MFNRLNPEARIAVMQATDVARRTRTHRSRARPCLARSARQRARRDLCTSEHARPGVQQCETIVIDRHPVHERKPRTESGLDPDASTRSPGQPPSSTRIGPHCVRSASISTRSAMPFAPPSVMTSPPNGASVRVAGRGRGGPEGRRGRGGPRGHHHHHHDHQVEGADGAADSETGEDREGGIPRNAAAAEVAVAAARAVNDSVIGSRSRSHCATRCVPPFARLGSVALIWALPRKAVVDPEAVV